MANVSGSASESCSTSDTSDKNSEDISSSDEKCNGDTKHDNSNEKAVSKSPIMKGTPSGFLLRSSKLDSPSLRSLPSTPSRPFILNPSRLSNPFVKTDKEDNEPKPQAQASCSTSKGSSDELEEKVSTSTTKTCLSFVPLGGEATTPSQPTSFSAASTPSLGFVFGQNIHEKVKAATPAESTSVAAEPSPSKESQATATTNGTSSEMLFSVQVPKENTDKNSDGAKSLSEAAREYEEARAVKRKFEEVPVLTGEEEEANVLQVNCKLFSWSSCSWTERGRGTLRVNDLPTSPPSHRLIVRTAGSLRVVLNTKIWAEMTVDRASSKSLRITGMDSSGVVKVFLVMASPKEMDQLQKCLEWRVNNLKKFDETPSKKIRSEDS